MSTFGADLIQSLTEVLAHVKGEGCAVVHAPITPREVRMRAKLTQAQMAPLMGMSLSGASCYPSAAWVYPPKPFPASHMGLNIDFREAAFSMEDR